MNVKLKFPHPKSYIVGITAEEIIAKISDKNGVYIPGKHCNEFLGRGWVREDMYQMLLKKNFTTLPVCYIPNEYIRAPPGELSICSSDIVGVNDISVWAGTRFMSKEEFLLTAKDMLVNIPNNVKYYWDRLYPTLCLK